jgi:hypothetical protein
MVPTVSWTSFPTLVRFCLKSPVSTFTPIVKPFLGVSAVIRGTERVVDKFSDACPFLPEVARFHVFAHR